MHRPLLQIAARWLAVVLAAVVLTACEVAPGASAVTQTVQERLTQALGPDTIDLTSLRRMGSGPLSADAQGRPRRIVYFNAVLTLERDLDFSSWDALSVASFANLLGATEKGVGGLKTVGNQRGDRVTVHGSASFVSDGDGWAPVVTVLPEVGTPSAPLSPATSVQSQQLFARLMQLYERKTADPPRQRQIIVEEVGEAVDSIVERLGRLDQALILAGGPNGGEYLGVAQLLAETLVEQGTSADALKTAGSRENLERLRHRRADLALVQNNLAAASLLGTDPFAQAGPDHGLRALASLFPEPVHVMVASASPIADLRDLAGKRVAIGLPESGSRENALLLLQGGGLAPGDLGAVHEIGLEQGLADLAAGRTDAVIATINAPARLIQDAAARGQIRLLSLSPEVQRTLSGPGSGLVPLDLPPATYPGQLTAIRTLAVTALLAAPASLAAADVNRVLATLFERIDFIGAGSAAGSQINRQTAATGLTVPLHPAAAAYFSTAPADRPR
jgi:TRAP transporter TAXI family solute receptor